jgi:GNAT superfamily N-acetyltransferase
MSATEFVIRPCRPGDAEVLARLVRELAEFENHEDRARATAESFRVHLFGPRPYAEAFLAEVAGVPAGFALVFPIFSTFRGEPGLYLEDLFVRQEHRGRGIGKALLATVARAAVERGFGWMGWTVLDWNDPAIRFYQGLGARPVSEWTVYRLDDEPMARLASLAPQNPQENRAG